MTMEPSRVYDERVYDEAEVRDSPYTWPAEVSREEALAQLCDEAQVVECASRLSRLVRWGFSVLLSGYDRLALGGRNEREE